MTVKPSFQSQYGPWAVIAGASEGLGAAFAQALGERGLNIVLVARREEPLRAVAAEVQGAHGVQTRVVLCDLATPDAWQTIADETENLEVGLLVYNAAYHPIGPFLKTSTADLARVTDVNCRTATLLAHHFAKPMVGRGRGGVLLMSSLSGLNGCGLIATYAASKAFDRVLAEGLWYELKDSGIDVVTVNSGAISTPNYERSKPRQEMVPPMTPVSVAEDALNGLRDGVPNVYPGKTSMVAKFMKKMPRTQAVETMSQAAAAMYGEAD